MPDENDHLFERCFDRMDEGMDQPGMIAYLHSQRAAVGEAVLIAMKFYGLRMKEAGRIVANHPAWREEIEALGSNMGAFRDWFKRLAQPVV